MSRVLSIEYPDEVLASVGLSEREFAATARFLLAAQLHASGKLSAHQAADLSGMSKVEFLQELAEPAFRAGNVGSLQADDAETELRFARGHCTDL